MTYKQSNSADYIKEIDKLNKLRNQNKSAMAKIKTVAELLEYNKIYCSKFASQIEEIKIAGIKQ